jgi:competence protein ComEC
VTSFTIQLWKKAPFIRFLLPLMAGIIVQWNLRVPVQIWWWVLGICLLVIFAFFFIPFFSRFKLFLLNGITISIFFLSIGAMLAWYQDIRHNKQWLGNFYKENDVVMVTLDEPPVEKTKSVKADASVNFLAEDEKKIQVKGKIILYFQKDSLLQQLAYGSKIIFKKPLQEIKNSGNPGGFNYKRFSLFQGITYQVYLKPGEFTVLNEKNEKWLDKFLYSTREKVIHILRKYIPGEKEQGLAEALLIGYKDDLDKNLVQSYTNTGVVHIIAISGMHLALVYWLLVNLLKPLQRRKHIKWLRPILIIAGLWLFSLLAGAQASVLRSAVMFTCIVWGENLSKKTSIFNTLAVSAFILLCYNPYWLWDVGFQLSYAAVLSIVIFMRPIYDWFYIRNKLLDFIWKLNAVTIAAQILTVPVSMYHFHQFPNYFLLTNFIAVPLSSAIVLGEILLCVLSFFPVAAILAGKLLSFFIWMMNSYIERIEALPFSLWDGLQINIAQTVLLLAFVASISFWLMEKIKAGLKVGLIALFGFILLRSYSFLQSKRQQKLIVYNVPQRQAVDLISGRDYFFVGDSDLLADDFVRNFHLKPSRILNRITPTAPLNDFLQYENYIVCRSKKIMMLDKSVSFIKPGNKEVIDLVLISKNPKVYISRLANSFDIKEIVFDGSVPAWKVQRWKKDCDSLHIPYYDVNEKGAFVMKLR